jgi:hypothetical protein
LAKKVAKAVGGAVVDTAESAGGAVVDTAKSAGGAVVGVVSTATGAVVAAAGAVADGDPKSAVDHVLNGVVDTAGAAADGVVDTVGEVRDGVVDTADAVGDGVVDTIDVVGDHVKDIANSISDCVSDLDDCALLNPLWGALPSCLLEGKPHLCFVEPAELLARYAARFQKIAAMGFYEVGEALLNLAKDFGKRRFADCSDGARVTNEMGFPVGARFTKDAPFIEIDTIKLEGCLDASTVGADLADLFSDCFMRSLRGLLPQVIAIWKDGDIGDYAACAPEDHFAVTMQVKLIAAGMVKPPAMIAAGGSIGLVLGCEKGGERMEMLFGYQAGLKVAATANIVDLQLLQQIGFLTEWPSHVSKAFQEDEDHGHLEVNTAWPSLANPVLNWLLNKACRDSGVLPEAVVDVLCRSAIPQSIAMLFEPPRIEPVSLGLPIGPPRFQPPKLVGAHMAWIMTLFEKTTAGAGAGAGAGVAAVGSTSKSVTRNGNIVLKGVAPTEAATDAKTPKKWLSGSVSLGVLWGNFHVFGRMPHEDFTPCDGWKSWNVTVEEEVEQEPAIALEPADAGNSPTNTPTAITMEETSGAGAAASSEILAHQQQSAGDSGLRGAQDHGTDDNSKSTDASQATGEKEEVNDTTILILASVLIGVVALSVVVMTARVYSDCKSAKSAVRAHHSAVPAAKCRGVAEIVAESGREVHVEVVNNPLDSQDRLQACISTWTQHTCPDSGDTYFYSDPDLGGTGATAWHLPQ